VRPVLLFADLLVVEAATAHDAARGGDHPRVAAEEDPTVAGVHAARVRVLAEHVLDPADFSRPRGVVPRPADRGHVGEPGELAVERAQLVGIAELLRTAGTLQGRD